MAGLFGLSAGCGVKEKQFSNSLYWGVSYVRHLGEESCGLAVSNKKDVKCESRPGLFSSNFSHKIGDLRGSEGIGYCGRAAEPFFIRNSRFGSFAVCFSGSIFNIKELISELDLQGHIFERGDETEVMAKLIVQKNNIIEGIEWMDSKVEGSYIILLLAKSGLYAARSSSGQWTMTIGKHKKEDIMCISSDTVGFHNLGFRVVREIKPGEIVFFDSGKEPFIKQGYKLEKKMKVRQCSFWPVYASSPAGLTYGKPAILIREQLGACLARRDIESDFIPHMVIPVPDSGRGCALGYHQEFCRQIMNGKITRMPFYKEGLIKYGFFRSFLAPSPEERRNIAHYKIVITSEKIDSFLEMLQASGLDFIAENIIDNKRIIIVVCDDSIVRGNQAKTNLVPKIKGIFENNGVEAEIHLRISFPEIFSYCPFNDTTKKGEILAELVEDKKERARILGVKSIAYNTLDDLEQTLQVPRQNLCIRCALKNPV